MVVSCVDIASSFNVKLTATATSGVGCGDINMAEANVTVLGDYNVTITPQDNINTTFCLQTPQEALSFSYQVSSVPATNLTLALANNAAGCSLSSTTGVTCVDATGSVYL